MKNELKILAAKLDKVIEQQELILKALDNKIVLDPNHRVLSENERETKLKMEMKQHVLEIFALAPHKRALQQKFNLKAQPHASRVKAYLKTNDPSVFDGLQRN